MWDWVGVGCVFRVLDFKPVFFENAQNNKKSFCVFFTNFFLVFKNAFLKITKRTRFQCFEKLKTQNGLKTTKRTCPKLLEVSCLIFFIFLYIFYNTQINRWIGLLCRNMSSQVLWTNFITILEKSFLDDSYAQSLARHFGFLKNILLCLDVN